MKTPETFREFLLNNGACHEATQWTKGKTLRESWDNCTRADWMIWLLVKMGFSTEKLIDMALHHLCTVAQNEEEQQIVNDLLNWKNTDFKLPNKGTHPASVNVAYWHAGSMVVTAKTKVSVWLWIWLVFDYKNNNLLSQLRNNSAIAEFINDYAS